MALAVRPLTESFGAEVSGFDAACIGPDETEALATAFLERRVLVVRGSVLSDDDLVAFGRCFGSLEMALRESPLASRREIMVVSNIRKDGRPVGQHPDGELVWHFDRIHQKIPNKAGVLHAVETPSQGGETLFADMCGAFDALPESMKNRLDGLTATNAFTYGANRAGEKKRGEEGPSAVHPAVRRMPETGRRALYVCRLMTDRLNGLSEEESDALLDELFAHSEDRRFVYMHKWSVGDVVLWDNRCAMHARNDFDGSQRRLLKRVTVGDDVPPLR